MIDSFVLRRVLGGVFPTPQGAWKDGPAARFVVDGYPRSEEQLRPGTVTEPICVFFFERFGVGSFR